MPHITLDLIAKGQLEVISDQQLNSIRKQLTMLGQASAVAALTPLIQQRTGLPLNESRAISRRAIRIIKAEVRDNLSN